MAAVGARAAGVLRRNGYQQSSPPQRLVLQPAAQLERRSVQNGAVQSWVGFDVLLRRFAQVLYLQVLDDDNGVAFADAVRPRPYARNLFAHWRCAGTVC